MASTSKQANKQVEAIDNYFQITEEEVRQAQMCMGGRTSWSIMGYWAHFDGRYTI